jgi:hypothetical protein
MKLHHRCRTLRATFLCIPLVLAGATEAGAPEDAATRKIAAVKESLQSSVEALRIYEWIETVTVTVDGEQKSRKQSRCYWGAEGGLQKVPVEGQSTESPKMPRGLRGRIAKKKAKEMDEYVHAAMALVKEYVPPDEQRMQAVMVGGDHDLEVMDGASRLRAVFSNYLKYGDTLFVDVDPSADRIVGISVSTYLEDPDDAVGLEVTMGTLPDGTIHPARIELTGHTKELHILIENTEYHQIGS